MHRILFSKNSSLINSIFWHLRKKEIDYGLVSFSPGLPCASFDKMLWRNIRCGKPGKRAKMLFKINA